MIDKLRYHKSRNSLQIDLSSLIESDIIYVDLFSADSHPEKNKYYVNEFITNRSISKKLNEFPKEITFLVNDKTPKQLIDFAGKTCKIKKLHTNNIYKASIINSYERIKIIDIETLFLICSVICDQPVPGKLLIVEHGNGVLHSCFINDSGRLLDVVGDDVENRDSKIAIIGSLPKANLAYLKHDYLLSNENTGSGKIQVFDRENLKHFLISISKDLLHNSCGECVVCREGLNIFNEKINNISDNTASLKDIEFVDELISSLKNYSECEYGILSSLFIENIKTIIKEEVLKSICQ